MTNNLQEAIDRLQAEIDKLKAEIKLWPQEDDEVYGLHIDGDAIKYSYKGRDTMLLCARYQGNLFPSPDAAIKVRERRAVEQKLRVIAKGYEFIAGEDNYYLARTHKSWFMYDTRQVQMQGLIYFANEQDAEDALALGEIELDKLL
jgi:hypothetical protein